MPVVSGISYSSMIMCGFIFNYLIRHFRLKWWMQYNYILAVSLNAGTMIAMAVIFFTLTLPKMGDIELSWWGNRWFFDLPFNLNWISDVKYLQ